MQLLLLKDDLTEAAPGETGELCVRGSGLAAGYFADAEKTDAAFIQNPLCPDYRDILYRTGDMAVQREDGNFYFLARRDGQIKHMGYRIELGEIETALYSVDGLHDAVCFYDAMRDKIVCVYAGNLDTNTLAKALRTALPKYMLPNVYEKLEALPHNANGKLDRAALNNILSIAEFNAPLVPGIRSVEYPSMNKDGVPFGVMTGALALLAGQSGFTGNKHLLEADEYRHYLDDLGRNHEVMALYFKPYPCCRWGHPAIDACLSLMAAHRITAEDIEAVTIETFYKATQLSKDIPSCADAAQYNIAYPVAAAIVNNGFSIQQVENTGDTAVIDMMGRLSFVCDPELDAQFPARRLCRATMVLKDGRRIISDIHEPRGEACENIGYDWLADKFRRITAQRLTGPQQETLIQLLHGDNWTVRQLVSRVNAALL